MGKRWCESASPSPCLSVLTSACGRLPSSSPASASHVHDLHDSFHRGKHLLSLSLSLPMYAPSFPSSPSFIDNRVPSLVPFPRSKYLLPSPLSLTPPRHYFCPRCLWAFPPHPTSASSTMGLPSPPLSASPSSSPPSPPPKTVTRRGSSPVTISTPNRWRRRQRWKQPGRLWEPRWMSVWGSSWVRWVRSLCDTWQLG